MATGDCLNRSIRWNFPLSPVLCKSTDKDKKGNIKLEAIDVRHTMDDDICESF